MGSCLAREKSPRISEDAPVPQVPLDITIETLPISELFDYVDHFDNSTYGLYQIIVDPTDQTRVLIILNADSKQSIYRQHQIRGSQQTIYIQLHNILSNGENVFIGAIHDIDNCLLITKVITGLAASVMVQELQSLSSIDDLEGVVIGRNKDKYMICGSIIIQDNIVLVFRKYYSTMQILEVKQLNGMDTQSMCIVQFGGLVYGVKKQ